MKECPKCGNNHNKNGIFCCRKCANSRTWSVEDKLKKSNGAKKFYKTECGEERKKALSIKAKQQKPSKETKEKISAGVLASITDEKRKQMSERHTGKKHSLETKQKLSDIAISRGFGGITSKKRMYFRKNDGEVIYLQSSYEIRFAEILETLNIAWSRPGPFIWVDSSGKKHRYYPDFKIKSVFIDTKNDYLAIVDLPKITAVKEQNNIDLRIVTEDMITKEFVASLV